MDKLDEEHKFILQTCFDNADDKKPDLDYDDQLI